MTKKLTYNVCKFEDGYAAYREESPYFFLTGDTKEEAIQIGDNAIKSYCEIFHPGESYYNGGYHETGYCYTQRLEDAPR